MCSKFARWHSRKLKTLQPILRKTLTTYGPSPSLLTSCNHKISPRPLRLAVVGGGMPSRAELLAMRFCNPNKTAPMFEELGGYLQAMKRADLTQVEGVAKPEQTLLGALINHFDAMDDMKTRVRALEMSACPQELEHLTNKSAVMETAIQDFRVSVKGALDRRLSKRDLNKVTAKYDKALGDLLKRSNADRDTAKELADNLDDALAKHAKDLNDLAEKQAQDPKDPPEDHLRGTPPAGRGTIAGQAPKRPLADASDAGNRLGSAVPMFDANDLFLDADFLDDAHHGDENHAKKRRRVDDAMGKMDFGDIVRGMKMPGRVYLLFLGLSGRKHWPLEILESRRSGRADLQTHCVSCT
jgi:hypothetical protein